MKQRSRTVLITILLVSLFSLAIIAIFTQIRQKYVFRSGSAVVKEMQSLNRLETAQFTIEKIIDAGTSGNAIQNLLFGDQLLFIAHGEVVAGFDLSKLNSANARVSGDSITLELPEPEILFVRLDSEASRVYDRRQGLLTKGDKDLESAARLEAEQTIKQAACESGILTQATENGRKQLTAILRSFGFTTVTIQIPVGSC